MESLVPVVSVLLGALAGGCLSYMFSLKKDREERRRERIVAHLIEAYKNLEKTAERKSFDPEISKNLESSVAAIFLFGSEEATAETRKFCTDLLSGRAEVVPLLEILRKDLRRELGLKAFDVKLGFLRV